MSKDVEIRTLVDRIPAQIMLERMRMDHSINNEEESKSEEGEEQPASAAAAAASIPQITHPTPTAPTLSFASSSKRPSALRARHHKPPTNTQSVSSKKWGTNSDEEEEDSAPHIIRMKVSRGTLTEKLEAPRYAGPGEWISYIFTVPLDTLYSKSTLPIPARLCEFEPYMKGAKQTENFRKAGRAVLECGINEVSQEWRIACPSLRELYEMGDTGFPWIAFYPKICKISLRGTWIASLGMVDCALHILHARQCYDGLGLKFQRPECNYGVKMVEFISDFLRNSPKTKTAISSAQSCGYQHPPPQKLIVAKSNNNNNGSAAASAARKREVKKIGGRGIGKRKRSSYQLSDDDEEAEGEEGEEYNNNNNNNHHTSNSHHTRKYHEYSETGDGQEEEEYPQQHSAEYEPTYDDEDYEEPSSRKKKSRKYSQSSSNNQPAAAAAAAASSSYHNPPRASALNHKLIGPSRKVQGEGDSDSSEPEESSGSDRSSILYQAQNPSSAGGIRQSAIPPTNNTSAASIHQSAAVASRIPVYAGLPHHNSSKNILLPSLSTSKDVIPKNELLKKKKQTNNNNKNANGDYNMEIGIGENEPTQMEQASMAILALAGL